VPVAELLSRLAALGWAKGIEPSFCVASSGSNEIVRTSQQQQNYSFYNWFWFLANQEHYNRLKN
jgi:hypothetical protein